MVIQNVAGTIHGGEVANFLSQIHLTVYNHSLNLDLLAASDAVRPFMRHLFAFLKNFQTISTLSTFLLAMLKYPEAQARAQQELDSIIGPNRLPSFADKDTLPYLTAVLKECLRWEISLPLCIPHQSTEDDVYNGYHIPAGTLVLPNSWYLNLHGCLRFRQLTPCYKSRAVCNNESVYPDPRKFNPNRFLTEDGKLDPSANDPEAAWGYGRRIW